MPQPITTSVFDLFQPGLGPSATHFTAPMIAAGDFRRVLQQPDPAPSASRRSPILNVNVVLHGSLAIDSTVYRTDEAVVAGLFGYDPGRISPDDRAGCMTTARADKTFSIDDRPIRFDPDRQIFREPETAGLPHPNTVDFVLTADRNREIARSRYLSTGGGTVEMVHPGGSRERITHGPNPRLGLPLFNYTNCTEVQAFCRDHDLRWSDLVLHNERAMSGQPTRTVLAALGEIWTLMKQTIQRGIAAQQQAGDAMARINDLGGKQFSLDTAVPSLAHVYALAVGEENAAGRRVVIAPTNGGVAVIPAVFAAIQEADRIPDETILRGLLAAGLAGSLIQRASVEYDGPVGCHGQVGAATAMAAAGLVEMTGGTIDQVECAAELCLQYHLGMSCHAADLAGPLPCLDCSVMATSKVLQAANLAMAGQRRQPVSLDRALKALVRTGNRMHQQPN